MAEDIDYKAVAEQLQVENERLRVRIAMHFKRPGIKWELPQLSLTVNDLARLSYIVIIACTVGYFLLQVAEFFLTWGDDRE